MKRVIAYSLFSHHLSAYEQPECGESRGIFFTNFLPALVRAHRLVYPDWEFWLYHDGSIYHRAYGDVLLELESRGIVKLFYMGPPITLCGAMMWRLSPLWNPDVEVVLCRDVDALPTFRERASIDDWLKTGPQMVHSINDSVSHHGMMGGMCGYLCERFWKAMGWKNLGDVYEAATAAHIRLDVHGADQQLLRKVVQPKLGAAIRQVNTADLGEKRHELDAFTNHVGGAYHVGPLMDWFLEHPDEEIDHAESYWPEPADKQTRFVVLSSTPDPTYCFFLPIVASAWAQMGYGATVLLTGGLSEWYGNPAACLALKWLRRVGARVGCIGPVKEHRFSTIAQVARFYAAHAPWHEPDDYLLTSDVDMLPLSYEFFHQQDMSKPTHLFYANAYRHAHYPVSYVGQSAARWRAMFPLVPEPVICLAIQEQLDVGLHRGSDSTVAWNYDEQLLGARLKEAEEYPDGFHMIDRQGQPPKDRMDRCAWPALVRVSRDGKSDAHLLRPGYGSHWDLIRPLIDLHRDRFDAYRGMFMELAG